MGCFDTPGVWVLMAVVLAFIYRYVRSLSSFWADKGVPFAKSYTCFGNLGDTTIGNLNMAELLANTYKEFKGERFCGIWRFVSPSLLVIDPELIGQILVKDFRTWSDRGIPCNQDVDPLSANLVNLEGREWRWVRVKMSPAFTPSRLKLMFTRLLKCGNDFEEYLENLTAAGGVVDAGDMCCRFVTDVAGSCAFGMKLKSLSEGEDVFYRRIRDELTALTLRNRSLYTIQTCFPRLFKLLKISTLTREFTEFFLKLMKQYCDYRDENDVQENDVLGILRKMINTERPLGEDDMEFDEKSLAAQAFDFFVGALESSPATISYCLHEMAVNEKIQDRLREEVHRVKAAHGGEITWDAVHQMEYLDMVVQETLRKYPFPGSLLRTSVAPYRIPGTEVDLPAGSTCDIPIYAIHRDPEYYPDPETFDPERFTPEAKSQRPAFTFLPFGAGPRGCIGRRLGYHQVKVGLVKLVDKFKISLCEKSQNSLEFDPQSKFLAPIGGIWIRVSRYSHDI